MAAINILPDANVFDPNSKALRVEDFSYNEDEILQQYKQDKLKSPQVIETKVDIYIEIYKYRNSILETVANRFHYTLENIRHIIKEINGYMNRTVGHLFEAFYEPILKQEFDVVETFGGERNVPDFKCWSNTENCWTIINVKCFDISEFSRSSYSVSYTKCRPEIETAQIINEKSKQKAKVRLDAFNRQSKILYKQYADEKYLKNTMMKNYTGLTFLIQQNANGGE
jgi:hypothetical protein